ncbi:MAG: ATP-binding protein [Ardenticatenales bacterium]|nr:ATP-binding protein [Ardenticatenales bacterium]
MPILGKAIAAHIQKLKGLYSVELPSALNEELVDLVSTCNSVTNPSRALLVVEPNDADVNQVKTTTWAELLGWRTNEDRVFAWQRGVREPDTSFQSVVKPFISSRFPGNPGGECTLDLLARLSIEELWKRRNLKPIGDTFTCFLNTARWIANLLRYAFEKVGSTPSIHWSDQFLVHWAQMLIHLDHGLENLANLGALPQPRHAWEIVRLAGVPVPGEIAKDGNPFLKPPEELGERGQKATVDLWQSVVEDYVLTQENTAVLLTALDWKVLGAGETSSWRDLNWNISPTHTSSSIVAAPKIGQMVFTSSPSPTLLNSDLPTFPNAPKPAWWGITDAHIQESIKHLHETVQFEPTSSCSNLSQALEGHDLYWLHTRSGTVAFNHTKTRWRCQVTVRDLELVFKHSWKKLIVSHSMPNDKGDGYVWLKPDDVTLKVTGAKPGTPPLKLSTVANLQLSLAFDLVLEYSFPKDEVSKAVEGSWRPIKTVRIQAKVHDCVDGEWKTSKRFVDASLKFVVPSPSSPTILVGKSKGKVIVAPNNGDNFTASFELRNQWEAELTPNLVIKEEGLYEASVYDGRLDPSNPSFLPEALPGKNGKSFAASTNLTNEPHRKKLYLDEGDAITIEGKEGTREIAIVKVQEVSGSLSSGLLSAIRGLPSGQRPPSSEARSSLLGRYQDAISGTLCTLQNNIPNSLYQYVVSTGDSLAAWPSHNGGPSPQFVFEKKEGFVLPGIENGPSENLINTIEWSHFMTTVKKVCSYLGFESGNDSFWLSGFNPKVIPGTVVKSYVEDHQALVKAAKEISLTDAFWAAYPFSIAIVEGKPGAMRGQLLSLLLSPLHPARLAWAFSLAFIASGKNVSHHLLGLAEGWNIPFTGYAINAAGQKIPLIAIPTDPGQEQDFVSWSALAVLDLTKGLAELPASAAGLPLPWGGQTGINRKVVEHALKDYLKVYSHINSLEIDMRSISETPRSREIDEAVLRLLGGSDSLKEIENLGGSVRVWDSTTRLGFPPSRDELFVLREEDSRKSPFEWRIYSPASNTPLNADLAFVENSSVHLAPVAGTTKGVIGLLPLRRFFPPTLRGLEFDQNYAARPGEDLLGLSSLLKEIEYATDDPLPALRARPRAESLGVGLGARWEVLGTFNLDPGLLSTVVALEAQSSGKRLLWEWRPSWLGTGSRGADEISRRPYYVIGKIPASLLKALEFRQGFTSKQASRMLLDLGRRGIGVTSLQAAGGTQESAAAGYFYALNLLLPSPENPLRASWVPADDSRIICGLIPIDPVESILEAMSSERLGRRADLLAVQMILKEPAKIQICLLPIEIKHHGRASDPEPLPGNQDKERNRARKQLAETTSLVKQITNALDPKSNENIDVLSSYARLLGLATLLDLAMGLTPIPVEADIRRKIISHVLKGQISIGVGEPILLWFAPGSITLSGKACLENEFYQDEWLIREVFIDPTAVRGLWWNDEDIGPDEKEVRTKFDSIMKQSISTCQPSFDVDALGIQAALKDLLNLVSSPRIDDLDTASEQKASNNYVEPQDQPDLSSKSSEKTLTVEQKRASDKGTNVDQDHGDEINGQVMQDEDASSIPDKETNNSQSNVPSPTTVIQPATVVGWPEHTSRWAVVGKLLGTDEIVALDFDHPKTVGIFGYMGSGKSYLLGTIIESALESIPNINSLSTPLAVVIFNYRRNALDRFELTSLSIPNQKGSDIERLATQYGATPQSIRDIHILCLPGELTPERQEEYSGIPASELYFDPATLTVEDWELLMGEPGSGAVFARTIRHALRELRSSGEVTLENLENLVSSMLRGQSRTAAQLRFEFVRQYISQERGLDFNQILKPGRALVLDLRQPLFNKEDALRFFLVCTNYVSRIQGRFNKLIVFDEAHEYLSNEFGEKIESRIRLMRHEGTSYVFATQDVGSIPLAIRRFITTRFVFDLGTRENVEDLLKFAPEFSDYPLQGMHPGECFVQTHQSTNNVFARPRVINVRPRVTHHGGASRIFSKGSSTQES